MTNIYVEKRDGSKELLDLEKIHQVLTWACEGIKGVSVSEIELKSQLKFFNGIKSSEIHETLTKTAADLISADTPNYQYVASKLANFKLRKEVYGQPEPWAILKLVERNVALGFYTAELLDWYSTEEWAQINKMIKHDRDYTIVYAGMGQWLGKYLVKNRVSKEIYETPQAAYALIAATLFHSYPKETRMKFVKEYYDAISTFDISIPTPILAGCRTKTKQFSSCVLIDTDDSLDSINATASSIVNYVAKKAGIGLNISRIRALGSEVRNGEIMHTGIVPFMKYFHAALKSCSQGGIRNGAATCHLPFWHLQVEDYIVLKNSKGIEENRIRHMDYSVQFNRLFFKRLVEKKNITLFSPDDVPDLVKAFYSSDNDLFEKLYEQYESGKKKVKHKKTLSAMEFISLYLDERVSTGRIYAQFVDTVNKQSSFDETKHPISMSNLCQEIALPTRPFTSLTDESGRIALCTLSAINWGNIRSPEDFEKPCELAVRALDALLSYQDYPVIQAKLATEEFRTLGIGMVNLAYFLAKNNAKYDDSALPLVDQYMEAMSYYLIKASVQLAKELGPCKLSHETKYGKGIFPFEKRAASLDSLVPHQSRMDWETLRQDVIKYGIRNATVFAQMPAESSAMLGNSTNGVEPVRGLITEKSSKDGVLRQVVPEFYRLKNKYDLLWDQPGPEGYLKVMAMIQKYADQSISVNTSYNPAHYNGKIPLTNLIKSFIMSYQLGLKNLYYNNTNDGATDDVADVPLPTSNGEADDNDCETCKL